MDVSTTSVCVSVYWVLVSAVGWFFPQTLSGGASFDEFIR